MPPIPADEDLRLRATIVIPVFNQVFYTRVCLASLESEAAGAEIIVVDNASSDGTAELLSAWKGLRPGRQTLRFSENTGFGRACNAGAELAGGDFVVFLNNDTFVLPGWLQNVLEPLADHSVYVTGSRLLYPNGRIQHAGVAFNEIGPWHVFVGLPGDLPLVLQPRDYQVVTGASLAMRTRDFRRLGGFDSAFQNGFEDVDLCLRVRKEGGRVLYIPSSVAYHFEAMSQGRTGPTDIRGYELFMQRWQGQFTCDIDEIHEAARREGYDLEQRTLSRRELMDFEDNLEVRAAELYELRRTVSIRSVRAALWARDMYVRLIHKKRG